MAAVAEPIPDTAAQLDLSPESLDVLAPWVLADFATETDLDTAAEEQEPRYTEYLTYIGKTMLHTAGSHRVVWPARLLPPRSCLTCEAEQLPSGAAARTRGGLLVDVG